MIHPGSPLGLFGMTRLVFVLGLLCLLLPAGVSARERGRAPDRETSIFYYPWYGNPKWDGAYLHWDQNGHVPPHDLATTYYPARGPYSSADPVVVAAQMRDIAGAGIQEVVSSWWGWGSIEDQRLPMILLMARSVGLHVAVQIEPYAGRTATSVASDIAHLRQLGIARFYVYRPFDVDETSWAAVLPSVSGVQVLAQTTNVERARAADFAGVYTYDVSTFGPATFGPLCARAHELGLICAPSVGPGYDALRASGDTHIRRRDGGATYDAMWRAAIRSGADRVTITSYNEWHEGTQIEPALTPLPRTLSVAGGSATAPVTQAYSSYEGAYGLRGRQASRAYLTRTAYWTSVYRAGDVPVEFSRDAGKGAAQGRKARAGAEPGRMMTGAGAPTEGAARGGKARMDASFCPGCRNLRSDASASRLMAAVRLTGSDTVVRPPRPAVRWSARTARGRPSHRARRPLALLGMSVIARCASSSQRSRSLCTRRTASTTGSYWGKS